LIRSADKVMYQIKRKGKNSFGFVNAIELPADFKVASPD
jgi:hypothetical protein